MTTTTPTLDELTRRLRRTLRNMRSVVRRPDAELTGRNARGVYGHYRAAYTLLVRIEDAHGLDAAAPFADRLTTLRHEATAKGLLSAEGIADAERLAVADADAARAR